MNEGVMKKPKAIVLDLDDTLVSFAEFLVLLYNASFGTSLSANDLINWDFKDIEIKDARGNVASGKHLREFFIEMEGHGLYAALPIIPEAQQALHMISQRGYKIIILTARPDKFKIDTEINLIKNFIPYDKLVFDWDKVKVINKLKSRYAIVAFADDKYSTVEVVKENCGLDYTFLVNKAHNQNINEKDGIIRIGTVLEMVRFLK